MATITCVAKRAKKWITDFFSANIVTNDNTQKPDQNNEKLMGSTSIGLEDESVNDVVVDNERICHISL